MGHIIVYCDTCGERILEEQIVKGKAFVSGGRYFCPKCKPPTPAAPIATPPLGMTPGYGTPRPGTLPKVGTTRRHAGPPQPQSSKTPIIVGGIIAGLALLGLLIFALTGNKSPAPSANSASTADATAKTQSGSPVTSGAPDSREKLTPPTDDRKIVFDELERFADQNPDKPEDILQRCRDAEAKLRDSDYFVGLRRIRNRAEEKLKERETPKKIDEDLARARDLADKDPEFLHREDVRRCFRDAGGYPGSSKFSNKIAGAEKEYDTKYKEAAEREWKKVVAEIDKAADPSAAFHQLEMFPEQFREGEWLTKFENRKREIEQKAREASEPKMWDDFVRGMNLFKENKYRDGAALLMDVFKRTHDREYMARQSLTQQQMVAIAKDGQYKVAAYFAREENNAKQACFFLQASVGAGFADWAQLDKDKDFDGIRDSQEFKTLMQEARRKRMGVNLQPLKDDEAKKYGLDGANTGMLIVNVVQGSVAEQGGMKAGDILIEIDKKPLPAADTVTKIADILKATKDGEDVPVVVIRDGQKVTLKLKWPKK